MLVWPVSNDFDESVKTRNVSTLTSAFSFIRFFFFYKVRQMYHVNHVKLTWKLRQ